MATIFFFQETKTTLSERKRLKSFIERLFKKNGKRLDVLTYVFCSDQYLLEINHKFLKHDYYTDILTFNLSTSPEIIEGEIYISIDRIKENAKIQQTTIKEELHRVIFHGALHLCGYNDKTKRTKKEMTSEEDKCLKLYLS
jgi:probable rRNA maturation factor